MSKNAAPILLVEDDPDIHDSLKFFFQLEGIDMIPAYHGGEALTVLRQGKPVRAILVDLMMPVMDGYEFIANLESPEFKARRDVPVIVLSASTDAERLAREKQFAFVKKPIDLDELLAKIKQG